jgi:hypothetical protein
MSINVPAYDFITMLMTVDCCKTPGTARKLLEAYHKQLAEAKPEAAKVYTVQTMVDDIAMACGCFAGVLPAFLMALYAGADALPEEKKKFTWDTFMPLIIERFVVIFNEFDAPAMAKKIMASP